VTLSWTGYSVARSGRDIVLDGFDLAARGPAGTRTLKAARLALTGIVAGPEGATLVARLGMAGVAAELPDPAGGTVRLEAAGFDLMAPDVPALLALALDRGIADPARAATFDSAAVTGIVVARPDGTRLSVPALTLGRAASGIVQDVDVGAAELSGDGGKARIEPVRLDRFDLRPLLGLPPGLSRAWQS
jgi:hypothetical protein